MIQKHRKTPRFLVGMLALVVVFALGVSAGRTTTFTGKQNVLSSNKSLPNALDLTSVNEAYAALKANYDGELDTATLTDGLKKGLTEATGDPYTEYFSTAENKSFNEELSGTFSGIGAELGRENNAVIVISPIKGFPAETAGLKSRDIIAKIDDQDALSLTITEAVKKIRGPKDTTVKLTVIRDAEQLDFTITRADISIPSVKFEVISDDIGYIQISRYSSDTSDIVKQAAADFAGKNIRGVILDVRGNPGGFLDQAIKVSSEWLPVGKTVVVEKRGGVVQKTDKAIKAQAFLGMPTVVLIDGGSASASEITAGALRDNGVAKLVGTKSYGKGSVQTINPLENGSAIKVTIARWFTPNDKNIDKEGIEPDEKVEITKDQALAKQDPQKEKALELLK